MRPTIFLLGLAMLLLATVGLTSCVGNQSSTGEPRIHFEEDFADVGTVPPGISLDYVFRFTNEGDAPLLITGVRIQVVEGC